MSAGKSSTLEGTRELYNESEAKIQIRYFKLVREQISEDGRNIYGVCVENHKAALTTSTLDEHFKAFLTDDAEQIDRIIDKLIGNCVTALTASEVIDFLYDETIVN